MNLVAVLNFGTGAKAHLWVCMSMCSRDALLVSENLDGNEKQCCSLIAVNIYFASF